MGQFDSSLGALLLATLINTHLYGLTTSQYASYFNTKFGDPLWMRLLIFGMFCFDSFHSLSIMYMTWEYLVTHFGEPTYVANSIWPLPFTAIAVSITAFIVQLFLAYRLYRLTGYQWILWVYSAVITGTLALGLVLGVKIMKMPLLAEIATTKTHLTVWLSLEVIIDSTIAAILFVVLHRSRTGFSRSDAIVSRLGRSAIQSGVLTTILAILALVCFAALPDTLFYATFGIPIGRAYTYSLLDTLMCRKEIRGILDGRGDTGGSNSVPTIFRQTDYQMQGIRKEVQTEVHLEDMPQSPTLPATTSLNSKKEYILSSA